MIITGHYHHMTTMDEHATWRKLTHLLSRFPFKWQGSLLYIYLSYKHFNSLLKCTHWKRIISLPYVYYVEASVASNWTCTSCNIPLSYSRGPREWSKQLPPLREYDSYFTQGYGVVGEFWTLYRSKSIQAHVLAVAYGLSAHDTKEYCIIS